MSYAEYVQPYVDELELERPIDYDVHNIDQIASYHDPEERRHHVVFAPQIRPEDLVTFTPEKPYLASFVHELCHLHLAEKIDSSFAGFTVEGTELARSRLGEADNAVVDMWVNDLFFRHFPALYTEHNATFIRKTEDFIRNKEWPVLLPPQIPINVGRVEADTIRHDLPQPDFKRMLRKANFTSGDLRSATGASLRRIVDEGFAKRFSTTSIAKIWDFLRTQLGEVDPNTIDDIAVIRDFLVTVPEMTYDRTDALTMHETVVNEFCAIGKLAVSARLVDEQPRPAWYIDS